MNYLIVYLRYKISDGVPVFLFEYIHRIKTIKQNGDT